MFDQEFFRPGGTGQPAPALKKNVRAGVGRSKGFSLNLLRLRTLTSTTLLQWRNEKVEEENANSSTKIMTDVIIDGNSLYARAWFATCRDYIDVNAVLRSAIQTVCSLLNRDVQRLGARIDRTLFCWDGDHGRDKGDHRVEKPPQYHDGKAILQEALTASWAPTTPRRPSTRRTTPWPPPWRRVPPRKSTSSPGTKT
jgi:hypothetical protein